VLCPANGCAMLGNGYAMLGNGYAMLGPGYAVHALPMDILCLAAMGVPWTALQDAVYAICRVARGGHIYCSVLSRYAV
jgi:hypothetical protein